MFILMEKEIWYLDYKMNKGKENMEKDEGKKIIMFNDKKIRRVWHDDWYFCVVDVVSILVESRDIKQYIIALYITSTKIIKDNKSMMVHPKP